MAISVLLMATGEIARPLMRHLHESPDVHLLGLVTQPDKPAGRRQQLTPPPLKPEAIERNIPLWQPEKLKRSSECLAEWKQLNNGKPPDLIVVMAYGQILRSSVLNLPLHGCWNVHASLLPKYRGASCIQAAIRNGDPETGLTMIWMDQGLDTGNIVTTLKTPISPHETGGSLHDRLADMAPELFDQALALLLQNAAPSLPQDHDAFSYAPRLEREHGLIHWDASAQEIDQLIRAYEPWPGTWCFAGNKRLKIFPPLATQEFESGNPAPLPGTLAPSTHPGKILVACRDAWLEIEQLQPEGKARMKAADFLRGQHGLAQLTSA